MTSKTAHAAVDSTRQWMDRKAAEEIYLKMQFLVVTGQSTIIFVFYNPGEHSAAVGLHKSCV